MRHPASSSIALTCTAISIVGLVVAALGGTAPGPRAVGLSVAGAAAVIAALTQGRTPTLSPLHSAHWWKYLSAGVASLTALVAITSSTGEFSSTRVWYVVMTAGLVAVGAVAMGLALAVAGFGSRRPTSGDSGGSG